MTCEFEDYKYAYEIDLNQDNTATKVLKLVGKRKKVLEFGCGPGHMSKILAKRMKCSVTGIELDARAAQHARRYCQEVHNVDLDLVNVLEVVGKERFDVILFADILEHLRRPEEVLSAACQLLRPNGYVVASVPNVGYCGLVGELLCGRFQYRELGLLDKTHIRFFTRRSLVSMFEANGFQIAKIDTFDLPVEYSEFKDVMEKLPEAVQDFMFKQADSLSYQFVLKAYKVKAPGLISKITSFIGLE